MRDPEPCGAYSDADRSVLRLADTLHENAQLTPSTWATLEQTFATEELVELLLVAGFWRMAAGFLKSTKIPSMEAFQVGLKAKNRKAQRQSNEDALESAKDVVQTIWFAKQGTQESSAMKRECRK